MSLTQILKEAIGSRIRAAIVAHDYAMVTIAFSLALLIPHNLNGIGASTSTALLMLVTVLALQGMLFTHCGLYRGVWRFASLQDMANILKAVFLGAIGLAALHFATQVTYVPVSAWILYPVLLSFLLATPRVAYRFWKDYRGGAGASAKAERVLIVGAGQAGAALVRDLMTHRDYLPIGFVDDDRKLRGSSVHGVAVLGTSRNIARLVSSYDIDLVLIAMPDAGKVRIRRIVKQCEEAGVAFRTLPRLSDLLRPEEVSVRELREVQLDDLLGREPVSLDWDSIRGGLRDRVVLVTGAGGSIGGELSRQLSRIGVRRLVCVERSEHNLFMVEQELKRRYPAVEVIPRLADVCNERRMDELIAHFHPDIIFHAAAYKHVPMLEAHLCEAVRNNVLGTKIVAEAAGRNNVKAMVLISTDKAVNPTNVMGATKRIAEIYCQGANRLWPTEFITVRFGNVLGSRGSVIPFFQQQIVEGGPVTVTDPEITRYFMTNTEACQLIMQAAVKGEGGEIYVLNMGEPVRIVDLAEELIRLSGKVPHEEIEILYTGLRPGEKMHEELFHPNERLIGTDSDGILLAGHRPLDSSPFVESMMNEMEGACAVHDTDKLRAIVGKLVPEFREVMREAAERPAAVSGGHWPRQVTTKPQ